MKVAFVAVLAALWLVGFDADACDERENSVPPKPAAKAATKNQANGQRPKKAAKTKQAKQAPAKDQPMVARSTCR
jgi:hypothetical protein